jgi:RNA polymerase sigma factor (sigma-70 family)
VSQPESYAAGLSDGALVARCRAGDARAWEELIERFARYVYAITTRAYGLSEHDAEDVFQDVFVRVYAQLDSLRDDDAIRPWIAQTARRLAIDRLRAASRVEPHDQVPELPSLDAELERIESALDVHRAMAMLPDNCQEILDRFFARDQSYSVIGRELGIAPGTIASRISRCLARLRAELEGEPAGTSPERGRPRVGA